MTTSFFICCNVHYTPKDTFSLFTLRQISHVELEARICIILRFH